MTLELTTEDERIIARGIDAGVISGAGDALRLGVEVVRQRLDERAAASESSGAGEWNANLHRWIDSHQTTAPLLSDEAVSRESIY